MKTIVIFNPYSGEGRGGAIASAVERSLVKRGLEVELRPTHRPKDATTIACDLTPDADIIVAVGGDGTINEVANGMACARAALGDVSPGEADTTASRRSAVLGIVPAGTANVLALELDLPFQVERACNVIAGGKTISLDLGMVDGRRFALMMGAGLDALTVRNIDPRAKRRYKELAFLATGVKAGIADRPRTFLVKVDREEHRASFFLAANSRYYAGRRLVITPAADPTDGLLDLLLFTGTTRSSLAAFWLGVPSGLHLRNPRVIYLRAERAELYPLEDSGVVWYQTDGELAGRLPAAVEIAPHAIDVLVP